MNLRAKILIYILFAFTFQIVVGQNLHFEHINEKNGLPNMNINAIHVGPNGYLWVAAGYGLYRYDGHIFETYYESEPSNGKADVISAIHSNINRIVALSKDRLLIINTSNQKLDKIYAIHPKIIKPNHVLSLGSEILIGSENGLWRFDFIQKTFNNLGINEPISGLETDGNGKVVIAGIDGFYVYYPFNKKLNKTSYQPSSFIQSFILETNHVITWLEADNVIHFGQLKTNQLFEEKNWQLTTSIAEANCLRKFQNSYLIATNNGLLSIDSNGKEALLQHHENEYFSISSNQISCILPDKLNNLWVATKTTGLNLYNGYRHKFEIVSPYVSARFSECKGVYDFAETKDENVLFLIKSGGIGEYSPKEKSIKKWVALTFVGNCIVNEKGVENSFLIGSKLGLHQFNHQTGKVEFISTISNIKNFESDIKCILSENDHTYWMAGKDGFFLFDVNKKTTIANYGISNSTLGSENIRSIVRKSHNELFICTAIGLYLFNTNTATFKLIKVGENIRQPFISNVLRDKKGRLWIGTSGEGVYLIKDEKETEIFSKKNGLTNNRIYAIQFDQNESHCWISTNSGLSSINMNSFEIENHKAIDGLQGNEFNESSSLATRNGVLYFGGLNGFNYFNPSQIINSSTDCITKIKSLSIFNNNEGLKSYYQIPQEKNYISIDFVALNYSLNEDNSYYYQLEGMENKWIDNGSRQFASFGELNPGDYVFKVKARNNDGKMSSLTDEISFTVKPFLYQRLWFKILAAVLFSSIIALVIYFRIKNAISEEIERSKQNLLIGELELKALRAQMNPHFIFNSLNSIQDFVLNNEVQLAAKYLSKFAKLIRMILDISEQTFTTINSKITFLNIYIDLECLRLNNSFKYIINTDPNIDKEALIPTLIIQPYIENAIWHGLQYKTGERTLKITLLKLSESSIQATIEDNGIGRSASMKINKDKNKQHQSQGLKKTEERFEVLKKHFGSTPKIEIIDLFDENNLACGTKVILQIPIKYG